MKKRGAPKGWLKRKVRAYFIMGVAAGMLLDVVVYGMARGF